MPLCMKAKENLKMKGQVSVEFFLLFVIVISIFSIFMFVSIEMQRQVNYLSNYNNALLVAFKIGNAVNTVLANDIKIGVQIPVGYEVSVQPGAVVATDLASNVSASWPIAHVPIYLNISNTSTLLNISMQNYVVHING